MKAAVKIGFCDFIFFESCLAYVKPAFAAFLTLVTVISAGLVKTHKPAIINTNDPKQANAAANSGFSGNDWYSA
ncbi:MAG: hypothetical protein LBT23_11670 [Synergistaceae bacterium]|nr:hypothetical protein [Synergistaceae bacterium]